MMIDQEYEVVQIKYYLGTSDRHKLEHPSIARLNSGQIDTNTSVYTHSSIPIYIRVDTKYIIFVEMAFESDAENLLTDMFQDPVGYFPPEPSATYVEHTLLCGQTIQLRLVGHNPLWVPKYCKLLPHQTFRT